MRLRLLLKEHGVRRLLLPGEGCRTGGRGIDWAARKGKGLDRCGSLQHLQGGDMAAAHSEGGFVGSDEAGGG